jgi:phosphomevalonate kinase
MHSIATPATAATDGNTITITSPQFGEGQWCYSIDHGRWVGGITEGNGRYNPFIEATISTVLSFVQPKNAFNFDITIYSDRGYHSQDGATEKTSTSGAKLFLYHEMPITHVAKTGMGSSAGLVVVVVAALLSYFYQDVHRRPGLVHNLAQVAHCFAQKKIGSGFDVAAAVYGSITYTRFDPKVIDQLLKHEIFTQSNSEKLQLEYSALLTSVVSSEWQFNHCQNSLPPHLKLLMGDISGGSNTPKLVSKVLEWKKSNPQQSSKLYSDLNRANEDFIRAIETISTLANTNPESYTTAFKLLSKYTCGQLETQLETQLEVFDKATLLHVKAICDLVASIKNIRHNLQLLTKYSGAEIEPLSQTELLDQCQQIKGCFGGVVPGAGGYDAIALLINDHNIDEFITTTKSDPKFKNVTWLQLHEESQGLVVENPDDYDGL